jgi:membrane protease YdiL (CAAX protease family)
MPGTYVRLPKLRDAAVAFAIPAGVMLLLPAGHYLFDRVQWAAHEIGRYSPPEAATYLDVSNLLHLSPFLALFASTAEEIVFRGMLLPEFVERHGTQRGIFLVGAVWAAIHFRSDSYSGMSFAGVLVQMAERIAFCLALNYVLSWMTLRQGSITSAAICHGVWNLLNFLPPRGVDAFPGQLEIKIVLIGVVAIVLFWFWPIKDERPTLASAEGSGPVAAT